MASGSRLVFTADVTYRKGGEVELKAFNLKAGGAEVMEEIEDGEYGRFGWFIDPEGHKVELWVLPSVAMRYTHSSRARLSPTPNTTAAPSRIAAGGYRGYRGNRGFGYPGRGWGGYPGYRGYPGWGGAYAPP